MEQLQGSPWLLAHRAMLKPNQPQKFSLLGQDYVLWQDSQAQLLPFPTPALTWEPCFQKDGASLNPTAAVPLPARFMPWSSIARVAQYYPVLISKQNLYCHRLN